METAPQDMIERIREEVREGGYGQVLFFREHNYYRTPWFLDNTDSRIDFHGTRDHVPALDIMLGYMAAKEIVVTREGIALPMERYAKKLLFWDDEEDRAFKIITGMMPLSNEALRGLTEGTRKSPPETYGLTIGHENVLEEEKKHLWFNKSYLDALAALGHPEPSRASGKDGGIEFTIPSKRTMEALLREGHIIGSAAHVEMELWRRRNPVDLKMMLD